MKLQNRKGQVWIETVLYTIIGLAIIGVVLAFILPKINQSKDNVIVEQSITSMKDIDAKIKDVARQQGNIGRIDLNMKRGALYINSTNDSITMVIDGLSSLYSEANVSIVDGNLNILSIEGSKTDTVYLTLKYPFNITYAGKDELQKITAAPLNYKLSIENINNKQIDIKGV